jgi:hypothetical protein
VISGISPYVLKYNDSLREQLSASMHRIKEAVDASIEELPRRKIRLAA